MKLPVNHKHEGKDKRKRKEAIALFIEKYLEKYQPRNYRLVVDRKAMVEQGEYWMAVVESDDPKAPLSDVIDRMVKAEMDIAEQTDSKIYLVPVIPPEDD